MLSQHIGLPQHKKAFFKCRSGAKAWGLKKTSYVFVLRKLLDTRISGTTLTQQLSNSASRLCPDKRAIFSFKQQHHYIFSSIFADGKRTVRLFYFKPQRALSMRRKIERRVDKDIPSKTLAFSASFAGALRKRTAKHIPYSQDSSINFVPHNYTLCIINYPLFSAFYRRSRPAVWFDSG